MRVRGLAWGVVLVGAGVIGYLVLDVEAPDVAKSDAYNVTAGDVSNSRNSPFTVQDAAEPEASLSASGSSISGATEMSAATAAVSASDSNKAVAGDASATGVASEPIDRIGRGTMSDADQAMLSAELRGDRAKLLLLIDSLRADGDAERIRRLSIVLGELGAPAVDALIEELAYSDDPALVVAGLDLMKRSGIDGGRARAVVSTLLVNASSADILVPALSAIARPGTATDDERQDMANQISLLAAHESADVRSASVDLLSRWTSDGSDTPTLLGALQDADAVVRRSAAYALVSHEHSSEDVVAVLLQTVENADEDVDVRKAAILAVQRSSGADVDQRQRVDEILKLMNRRRSRTN